MTKAAFATSSTRLAVTASIAKRALTMSPRLSPQLALFSICACLLHSLPAAAVPGPKRMVAEMGDQRAINGNDASSLLKSASAHYDAGNYPAALREFQAAQEIAPGKGVELSIARTFFALGNFEAARNAYVTVLRRYRGGLLGEQLTAADREDAEQKITHSCRTLVDASDFRTALGALLASIEVVEGQSRRTLTMLLGRTYEGLGDTVAAFQVYSRISAEGRGQESEKEPSELALALKRTRTGAGTVRGTIHPAGVIIRILEPNPGLGQTDTIDPLLLESGVALKIGQYKIDFSKPGYAAQTRDVTIGAGDIQRLDVTLQPNSPEPTSTGNFGSSPSPSSATSSQESPFPEQSRGYHEHDGFYLHMDLGVGYAFNRLSGGESSMNLSGGAASFTALIGGIVAGNFVLFGEMTGIFLFSERNLSDSYDKVQVSRFAIGAGVAYYLMPANVFFGGSLLASQLTFNDPNDEQDRDISGFGVGGKLTVGKEWWVSPNWALGVSGHLLLAIAKNKFAPREGASPTGGTWTGASCALSFSATYN